MLPIEYEDLPSSEPVDGDPRDGSGYTHGVGVRVVRREPATCPVISDCGFEIQLDYHHNLNDTQLPLYLQPLLAIRMILSRNRIPVLDINRLILNHVLTGSPKKPVHTVMRQRYHRRLFRGGEHTKTRAQALPPGKSSTTPDPLNSDNSQGLRYPPAVATRGRRYCRVSLARL